MGKRMRNNGSKKYREIKKDFMKRFRKEKVLKGLVIAKSDLEKEIPAKGNRKFVYLTAPLELSLRKDYLLKIDEKHSTARGKWFRKWNKSEKRQSKNKKNKSVCNCDMWTFASKGFSSFLHSEGSKLRQDLLHRKKVFWKTSKLSWPLLLPENTTHLLQQQNMLWRSLQHLQRLYEENRFNMLNMQHISEMFSAEFQKMAENHSVQFINDCFSGRRGENRKRRLSQWTFLRQKNDRLKRAAEPPPRKKHSSGPELELGRWRTHSHQESGNGAEDLGTDPAVRIGNHLRKKEMAPNSEEDSQISKFSKGRGWPTESVEKEPLRPPVYNPEDYATSLKKWGKKGSTGVPIPQYLSQSTGSLEKLSEELSIRKKRQSSPSTKSSSSIRSGDEKQPKKEKELTLKTEKKDLKNKENINRGLKSDLQKDFLNPILNLSAQTGEMSLRQFSSVTELLTKLKLDLKLSFPSFVQEFVGDPIDGVTLLLELLRCVQLSQTSQQQRCPPQILRRALLDEHSCLVCLKHCLRCSDASRRLASSPAGLFTLAVCIMSNVTQSRIIALELLIKACEPQAGGHKAVSEALSTLRLRFGEPVRFRFLVGMLSSAGAVELLSTAMRFINVFVESAPNLQQKVYIQAELEQAGFSSDTLRKTLPSNSESVKVELSKWEKNYFDVEKLHSKVVEVNVLQEKVHLLEKRIKILQEEKGILQSLEQCLKERCSELEEEVSIKTNASAKNSPVKPFRSCEIKQNIKAPEKGESTPAEDEGISSSEQELSQDEDYVKRAIPYNGANDLENMMKLKKIKRGKQSGTETNRYVNKVSSNCNLKNLRNIRSNKMKESNVDDGNEIIPLHGEDDEEEEETTIDEVIEELENIVNDAETEAFVGEEKTNVREVRSPFPGARELASEGTSQVRRSFASHEKITFEESEIVPAILHPQPPKKAKSLVHIYFPGSDLDSHGCNKNEFFEGSDSETSDSLLTAAREEKSSPKGRRTSLEISDSFNSYSSVNTRTLFIKQEQELEDSELNTRPSYGERNFDEDEIKINHVMSSLQFASKVERVFPEVSCKSKNCQKDSQKVQNEVRRMERMNEEVNGFGSGCVAGSGFQAPGKGFPSKALDESPFPRALKFAPTPVKRSQTFHITSSDGENLQKKTEVRPKPKMGVRGLDFQRSSEQKVKNENWMYQILEYKKSSEKRVEGEEKCPKRVSTGSQDGQDADVGKGTPSSDRRSSSESFSVAQSNRGSTNFKESMASLEKLKPAVRARSIEKMDEGLDSLVDIVISSDKSKKPKVKSDWNAEVSKNIGPRTRRSLAESSLFCSQLAKSINKAEESPKPPKPAQRTSLTRNNSSASPIRLPIEIKMAPVQLQQQPHSSYFGLKPAKSAENLLASSQSKRCPPDGSSTPVSHKSQESQMTGNPSGGRSPVYSTPFKSNKAHTFFGNPKFNGSPGSEHCGSENYFESNYAAVGNEKSVGSQPRNCLCAVNGSQEKVKSPVVSSNPPGASAYKRSGEKDSQTESKPNFLLGTYQSQPTRILSSKPKVNGSVLQSINSFNNNSFVEKSSASSNPHPRGRQNGADVVSSRQSNSGSGKVTDSPSGLY